MKRKRFLGIFLMLVIGISALAIGFTYAGSGSSSYGYLSTYDGVSYSGSGTVSVLSDNGSWVKVKATPAEGYFVEGYYSTSGASVTISGYKPLYIRFLPLSTNGTATTPKPTATPSYGPSGSASAKPKNSPLTITFKINWNEIGKVQTRIGGGLVLPYLELFSPATGNAVKKRYDVMWKSDYGNDIGKSGTIVFPKKEETYFGVVQKGDELTDRNGF